MAEGRNQPKPGAVSSVRPEEADALRKIHAETGLRNADTREVDLDDEVEPGLPLRETKTQTATVDPDLRADDESPLDVHRVLRHAEKR